MEGLAAAPAIAHFARDQATEAARALDRDGVIAFDGLWSPDLIARLHKGLRKSVPGAFDTDAPLPHDYLRVGERRINGLVPAAGPTRECLDLMLHPVLIELCNQALGKDWVYESLGVISSFPGETYQGLHADSPHLFATSDPADPLPAFALTISIPLVEVNAKNGSTEFLPGTHRNTLMPTGELAAVSSDLSPGDCMIWDFRVRHSGQANNSSKVRPLIYVTACRKFWRDSTNFRPDARKLVLDRQALASLAPDQRLRFVRAMPVPGIRTVIRAINDLVRWHAPGFHQAVRKLVLGAETIR